MEANQINALIKALQNQRDQALNGLATAQSELAVARDIIAALQQQNKTLREARPFKESIAA